MTGRALLAVAAGLVLAAGLIALGVAWPAAPLPTVTPTPYGWPTP